MSITTVVWVSVTTVAVMAAWLLYRSRGRDILVYILAYFAFFGFGPAVNYAMGKDIYFGIATERIIQASWGLLLALTAMTVVGVVFPVSHVALSRERLEHAGRTYHAVPVLLALLAGYVLSIFVWRGPSLLAGSKLVRIGAAGSWHYTFLALELLACSLYFLAMQTRAGRISYWVNMSCYIAYCLVTNERDFIFVLFSLLLHLQLFRPRVMFWRVAAAGSAFAVFATFVANIRGGPGFGPTQVLNQGSVLFVDTYVMDKVPVSIPFRHGTTYLDAVVGLLPSFVAGDRPLLMTWLVDMYARGSPSGYGFSLTAEAYLNFGMVGIPVVFALLAGVQRLLVTRVDRGHYAAYLSVLFTTSWMYGFRGESAIMVKTMAYGAALYGLLRLTATRDPVPLPPAPTAIPPSHPLGSKPGHTGETYEVVGHRRGRIHRGEPMPGGDRRPRHRARDGFG